MNYTYFTYKVSKRILVPVFLRPVFNEYVYDRLRIAS
jgi:hypothetical protein